MNLPNLLLHLPLPIKLSNNNNGNDNSKMRQIHNYAIKGNPIMFTLVIIDGCIN